MKQRTQTPHPDRRHQGADANTPERVDDLLSDDHVGGLLTRIRAVGCLIGTASEIADPAQVSVAGWLVEALAEEAQMRLKDEVRRQASRKAAERDHR